MRVRLALGLGVTASLAGLLALAQQTPPSRNVGDYVIVGLARVSLGSGVHVLSGNVGVNAAGSGPRRGLPGSPGTLFVSHDGTFDLGEGAAPVADTVRLSNHVTVGDVYANSFSAGPGTSFHSPHVPFELLGSGRTLFAAPPELPLFTCAGSAFGAFVLPDGPTRLAPGAYGSLFAKRDADVELAPGTYRFESIKLGTRATLVAAGPVTVNVCGDLRLSNAVRIGFTNERSARDFVLNVAGTRVAFGHGNDVTAVVRAPNAQLRLGTLERLRGQFIANAVSSGPRVEITCDTGSAHCARVTTTTIPRSSTTTTTPPASSTTLPRVTANIAEICGNCLDDDHDGLTDFEDPACCSDRQLFPMTVDVGRIRPHGPRSLLRLKALLAAEGLSDVNPLRQDVFLQIRADGGHEVFCAKVPAGRFVVKRPGVFRFRDPGHSVGSARGLDRLAVRIARNGVVRFRALARNAAFTSPRNGQLSVTVSFRNALEAEAGNRCATTRSLRTDRRGALRTP